MIFFKKAKFHNHCYWKSKEVDLTVCENVAVWKSEVTVKTLISRVTEVVTLLKKYHCVNGIMEKWSHCQNFNKQGESSGNITQEILCKRILVNN